MHTDNAKVDDRPLRIAVLCDYVEEHWPSMDLVGELLIHGLRIQQSRSVQVTRICPPFKRLLSAFRLLGRNHLAFNGDRLLNRIRYYPEYLRKLKTRFDVFHIIDHSYGHLVSTLAPARTVVTCHDIDTFRCLIEPQLEHRSFAFRAMTLRILKGIQSANAVLCVSRWTRDELLRYQLLPPERVTVVPTAVAPEFRPDLDSANDRAADELLGANATQPILLHVGSTIPRKRIDVLLKVFADLHRELPSHAPGARRGCIQSGTNRPAQDVVYSRFSGAAPTTIS